MITPKHEKSDVAQDVTQEQVQDKLPDKVADAAHKARQMAMDEALVVAGCTDLQQFLQQAQWLDALPDATPAKKLPTGREAFAGSGMLACHPGDPGKVLVIRGFENLLHYLDWFDTIHPAH